MRAQARGYAGLLWYKYTSQEAHNSAHLFAPTSGLTLVLVLHASAKRVVLL